MVGRSLERVRGDTLRGVVAEDRLGALVNVVRYAAKGLLMLTVREGHFGEVVQDFYTPMSSSPCRETSSVPCPVALG